MRSTLPLRISQWAGSSCLYPTCSKPLNPSAPTYSIATTFITQRAMRHVQDAGGATLFFAGMLRAHQEPAVISVSGSPGAGKTSFALTMAAVLAPFGTRCLYCTFEEDAETLRRRAIAVVPQYFRRTTL